MTPVVCGMVQCFEHMIRRQINGLQGARDIAASTGLRGLYSGLLPTLLRDVPELTLQFTLYEAFRTAFESHKQVCSLALHTSHGKYCRHADASIAT